jgi:hypothetical protein
MYTITPLLRETFINPTYGFEIHLTIPFASAGAALDLKLEITIRRYQHNLTFFTYQCACGGYYSKCNETSFGGDLCKIMAKHIISTTVAMVYKWSSFEEPLLDTDYVSTLITPHLRWYDRYTQRLTWKRLRKSQFLSVQLKLHLANDGNRVPVVIWDQLYRSKISLRSLCRIRLAFCKDLTSDSNLILIEVIAAMLIIFHEAVEEPRGF